MPEPKTPKEQGPIASSLEEFRYMQQLYQSQYMAIAQDINARAETLRDLDGVIRSLEEMDKIKERGALVPIGSETYLQGKITNGNSVIIGIGAGYFVEKEVAAAKGQITKAIDRETANINRLNKSKKELEAALIEISYKIEELSH